MSILYEYTSVISNEVPAVEKRKNRFFCQRCLNEDQSKFSKDELGIYCTRCYTFGKSTTYKQIKRVNDLYKLKNRCSLNKKIYLSDIQQEASNACLKAYLTPYSFLVYAVCGAGKTEIVYEVILKALNDNKIVCFATPRKDVVLEIAPRFKRDMNQVKIISLYSGTPDKHQLGNLYVTTTHQLINFYHYFDLVILDEVDAFPYYNNKMLEGFVNKAKKKNAPIIFLTATPTKVYQKLMRDKKLKYFVIPSRYHKEPIPVPRVVMASNIEKKTQYGRLPIRIYKWLISKKVLSKQVMIFVPNIEFGKKLESILKSKFDCQFVHAEMSNRKEIIDAFRNNEIQFIITTTILERGVTVSNVDACIILAHDEIFDDRAIVQIAGRVGRDLNFPKGDVILFSEYYTLGIKKAIKQIKKMNAFAYYKKLIRRLK